MLFIYKGQKTVFRNWYQEFSHWDIPLHSHINVSLLLSLYFTGASLLLHTHLLFLFWHSISKEIFSLKAEKKKLKNFHYKPNVDLLGFSNQLFLKLLVVTKNSFKILWRAQIQIMFIFCQRPQSALWESSVVLLHSLECFASCLN